jgi:hypothetical protein
LYVYSNKNIRRSVKNLFCNRIVHSILKKKHLRKDYSLR